jgi:hypothetical protein
MKEAKRSSPSVRRIETSASMKTGNMFEQAEATSGVVTTLVSVAMAWS